MEQELHSQLLDPDSAGPSREDVPETERERDSVHLQRMRSLDAFRGLVICLMILVDDAGPSYGHVIDHSPWDGITLADIVMPFFLFIVGVSMSLSFRRHQFSSSSHRRKALVTASNRSLKLFGIGLLMQGGTFPSGYDLYRLRIAGILQRIAFAYIVCVLIELFLARREAPLGHHRHPCRLYGVYLHQWSIMILLWLFYLAVMLLTTVPGCARGSFDEKCNAAAYYDRLILGSRHMYQTPVYNRSPQCSSCSPGLCPSPHRPTWCDRPFDPEGILSSFSAIGSCFVGLQFGHILNENQSHNQKTFQGFLLAFIFIGIGGLLHELGMPFNKNISSLSYCFFTTGCAALMLLLLHIVIDVFHFDKPFLPLIYIGMNAILVFILGASNVLDTILRWIYWNHPENNLFDFTQNQVFERLFGFDLGLLLFTVLKIGFWLVVSWVLYRKRKFFKV